MSTAKAISLAPPKSRLRKNGISVSSGSYDESILALLKTSPKTPSELAAEFGYTRQWSQKKLKALLTENKIKKVAGSQRYQLANQNKTKSDFSKNEITNSKFYNECETIKRMVEKMSCESPQIFITCLARICLGIRTPKFKINPDFWNHPETTIQCVKILKEEEGRDQLTYQVRQALRYFINLGLGIPTTKLENKYLGIEGDKAKPSNADLEMLREQYEEAKKITNVKDGFYSWNNDYLKFGVKFWISVRPSAMYPIEISNIKFFDRSQTFVELESKKFFKNEVIDFMKLLKSVMPELEKKIPIQKLVTRACSIKFLEFKTQDWFTKLVLDEEFAKALEKYVKQRKFEKKKYLFYDDNSTVFQRKTYKQIVQRRVSIDNSHLKRLLFKLGFESGDFGKMDRANYALRHFSLQNWLQLTDYDFGFVAETSHKDIATLKDWYGKRAARHMEQKLNEVVF